MVSEKTGKEFLNEITEYFITLGYEKGYIIGHRGKDIGKIRITTSFFVYKNNKLVQLYKNWGLNKEKYNNWFFEHIQPFMLKYNIKKDDIIFF